MIGKDDYEGKEKTINVNQDQQRDPVAENEVLFEKYFELKRKNKKEGAQVRKRLVFIIATNFNLTTTQTAKLLGCSGTTVAKDLMELKSN